MKIPKFLRKGATMIAAVFAVMMIASWINPSTDGFAQSQEQVAMSPTVDVAVKNPISVGSNPQPKVNLGLHNLWTVVQRRCGKYATKQRHHLFWHRWVIDQEACAADPSTVYSSFEGHNLVTDNGFDFAAKALSDTAAQPASCNYFAFAIDSSNAGVGTINVTDTQLSSSGTGSTELTTYGLARAITTFAHTTGTKTYTLSKAFSVTGTHTGVNKIGTFNAASTGTMCFELLFTPVTVNNLDTLTPTLTNTLSSP